MQLLLPKINKYGGSKLNYLSVENISKSFGERVLFEGLSFGLSFGDKVALIANNGTGKTSMLKIIAGNDVSDTGKITLRNGIRVGYLEHELKVLYATSKIEELINVNNIDNVELFPSLSIASIFYSFLRVLEWVQLM